MKLQDLFTLKELDAELKEGTVKSQQHPTLPLTIYNYTDKATYEQRWNRVTRHCRGLIIQSDTGEVIARGPRKFFNYGEPSATPYPLDTQVRLTRKEDGSLGIGWRYADDSSMIHYGVATRGSFASEQAEHATYELSKVFKGGIEFADTLDYSRMWEIVYPENRIVLDYAGRDELIPLGTVDNRTGLILYRPGTVLVDGQPAIMTLAEAIALPIPDDEEGYVLDILDEYLNVVDHLKLKGARYKELHSAIFGLSAKAIWEQCQAGTVHSFILALPDEVQGWADAEWAKLNKAFDKLWYRIGHALKAVYNVLGTGASRKDQAQYLMKHYPDVASPVFALLDKNPDKRTEWIWKQIKPAHVPFSAIKESISIG